jgi:hypothetical protein
MVLGDFDNYVDLKWIEPTLLCFGMFIHNYFKSQNMAKIFLTVYKLTPILINCKGGIVGYSFKFVEQIINVFLNC